MDHLIQADKSRSPQFTAPLAVWRYKSMRELRLIDDTSPGTFMPTSSAQNGLADVDTKAAITSLVRGLIEQSHHKFVVERRQQHRHPLTTPVNITPLGADQQPLGDEFPALTYDISTAGLSFLHTTPVEHRYLLVRFPQAAFSSLGLIVEVLRSTETGPFWIIAGRFRTIRPS
jgi:hypothetical protein